MAVDYSTAVRIGILDSIETTIGSGPKLLFYTGGKPGKCSDPSTGTLVATLTLTGDFMSGATEGPTNVVTKAKNQASTWSASATADGTIGYYRIYDSALTTCHEQGTVGVGSGDISLDNNVVTTGQTITITGKTITAGNAGV
jgi:hypothetical protein